MIDAQGLMRGDIQGRFVSLLPILMLAAVFSVLNRWFLQPWQLSEAGYRQAVILVATLRDLLDPSPRSLLVACVCIVLCVGSRSSRARWNEIQGSVIARPIVIVSVFLLAWIYSTYPYNHYFQRAHAIDRLLLWLLLGAVIYRPRFVFPFLLVLWPILGQFNVPLGGFSWAIPALPARIVLLFAASLLINGVVKKWNARSFDFLLLCVLAGHYFPSGVDKILHGWHLDDQIHYLLPNTYANGWLAMVSSRSIDRLASIQSNFNVPMRALTLLVEFFAVAFLWRRTTIRFFLCLWIVFHAGILMTSGIFFWPWIAIELVVLVVACRAHLLSDLQFTAAHFGLSVLLISSSSIWLRPVALSWIDSPVTYTYRVSLIGHSGQEYEAPPFAMAPYDYQFTLGGFHYLSKEPTLSVTWGATNRKTFDKLKFAKTADDVLRMEQRDWHF